MKKLGVIGGMGPAASALFYKNITEQSKAKLDQDHIPMVIVSDCKMPDRTKALLGTKAAKEKIYKKLLEDALYLKSGGCDCLAITCNTSHYFADRLEKEAGIKLFNMLRLTAKKAKEKAKGNKKVMLLATDGTVGSGLYQKELEAQGLEVVLPNPTLQKKVMYIIYDVVKSGKTVTKKQWDTIDKAAAKEAVSSVILGCTELSVARETLKLPPLYIDAMDVLTKECIKAFKK